jgi:hypothetical protein
MIDTESGEYIAQMFYVSVQQVPSLVDVVWAGYLGISGVRAGDSEGIPTRNVNAEIGTVDTKMSAWCPVICDQ